MYSHKKLGNFENYFMYFKFLSFDPKFSTDFKFQIQLSFDKHPTRSRHMWDYKFVSYTLCCSFVCLQKQTHLLNFKSTFIPAFETWNVNEKLKWMLFSDLMCGFYRMRFNSEQVFENINAPQVHSSSSDKKCI